MFYRVQPLPASRLGTQDFYPDIRCRGRTRRCLLDATVEKAEHYRRHG